MVCRRARITWLWMKVGAALMLCCMSNMEGNAAVTDQSMRLHYRESWSSVAWSHGLRSQDAANGDSKCGFVSPCSLFLPGTLRASGSFHALKPRAASMSFTGAMGGTSAHSLSLSRPCTRLLPSHVPLLHPSSARSSLVLHQSERDPTASPRGNPEDPNRSSPSSRSPSRSEPARSAARADEKRRRGGSKKGEKGGPWRGVQKGGGRDAKVIKEFGYYKNRSLQILDDGSGAYVSFGAVHFPLPSSWQTRPEGLSLDFVVNFVERRIGACRLLKLSNLPYSSCEPDLLRFLSPFQLSTEKGDPLLAISLLRRPDGASKGVAFARMTSGEEAARAVAELNGRMLEDRPVWVGKHLFGSLWGRSDAPPPVSGPERLNKMLEAIVEASPSASISDSIARAEESVPGNLSQALQPLGLTVENEAVSVILQQHNVTAKTACKLISELGKRRRLDKAMAVFTWTRNRELQGEAGVWCSVFHFNALISACERTRHPSTALRLLADMHKAGIAADTVTYSAVISALGKGRHWYLGLEVLERMKKEGVVPNVITFNALISSCEKASRLEEAMAVFGLLVDAQLQPDLISYSALLSACEKVGEWERAWWLFEQCKAEGLRPDVIIYNALISACDKGQVPEKAQEAFDMMAADGVPADVISYCSLISAYATAGDLASADRVWQRMKAAAVEPTLPVFHELFRACQPECAVAPAATYLEELVSYRLSPSPFTYGLVVALCQHAIELSDSSYHASQADQFDASAATPDPLLAQQLLLRLEELSEVGVQSVDYERRV